MIQVHNAGVNRPDVLQRKGAYPPPPGHSPLPGLEVAGVIVAVGPAPPRGVRLSSRAPPPPKPALGDRVCALVNGGGYAEFCVAPATQCLPIPAGLSMAQAACLPETHFTVWHNVFQQCASAAVAG